MKVAVLAGNNYAYAVSKFLETLGDFFIVGIDVQNVGDHGEGIPGSLIDTIPKMSAEEMVKADPDVVFSFSYPKIVSGPLLKKRCINWHLGKLPRFRGRHPVIHAIVENQRTATATFHLMTEKIDAGNVLLERQTPICSSDTSSVICSRLVDLSVNAFRDNILDLLDKNNLGRKQTGAERMYKASDLPSDKIDICDDPLDIYNKARAMQGKILDYDLQKNKVTL